MNFQKFPKLKMPEKLQNPSKMKGNAKILLLLQKLFSLPGFGRSETIYKCWNNIWLRNSSRLSQDFCVTKPSGEGQVPHRAPKISSPVRQKGQAQQCWLWPCLSFHNDSAVHEAKLGKQKRAEASAHPTNITRCVGSICLSWWRS